MSRSKKIGIDARVLMDAKYSGVPEFALRLIENILKIDNKNEYFLYCNSFSPLNKTIYNFENKFDNVKIVRTRYPNKLFNYVYQKTLKFPEIDKLLGVDVFYMPHINFAALGKESKKIITIHDLSFLRYPEFFSIRKNIWHKIINVKKLLTNFDKIVAVSEYTKNDLIDICGVVEDKIEVIHSGIDNSFKPYKETDNGLKLIKKKYGLNDKFIFYLGNLEPRKNVESIIKSFDLLLEKNKDLFNYELVLAGVKGWKYENIFKILNKSKNKDKIKCLGYVPVEDKVYLYNLASVFIYTSFYEGFGFPPLESISCGTPVISSNVSCLPEVLGECAILVNPYNTNDLVNSMELSINRRAGVMDDIVKIKNKYQWKNTAQKYIDLFTA